MLSDCDAVEELSHNTVFSLSTTLWLFALIIKVETNASGNKFKCHFPWCILKKLGSIIIITNKNLNKRIMWTVNQGWQWLLHL